MPRKNSLPVHALGKPKSHPAQKQLTRNRDLTITVMVYPTRTLGLEALLGICLVIYSLAILLRVFCLVISDGLRLTLVFLKLCATDRLLVVDECVKRNDSADERGKVHDEKLVVRARSETPRCRRIREVREQVQRVLQVIHDWVVHRQSAVRDLREVALEVLQACAEPTQRRELLCDARAERLCCALRDVAQEVLDTDLLRLLRLDGGRTMKEGFADFGAILRNRTWSERGYEKARSTYVFDLFHGKVGVRWDPFVLRPDVDDDHNRALDVALEDVVDLVIRRAQLGSRVIPPNHPLTR
jgi:hypothetical protein